MVTFLRQKALCIGSEMLILNKPQNFPFIATENLTPSSLESAATEKC